MEYCEWCNRKFQWYDWIEEGEPECEEHGYKFCSEDCQNEHKMADEASESMESLFSI